MKYFLKGCWQTEYDEVTKDQFIDAERACGFWPKGSNDRNKLATGGFGNGVVSGKIQIEPGDTHFTD